MENKKNPYIHHQERLGTTDENGQRLFVYPRAINGPWNTKRQLTFWLLIGIFLVAPWFEINGQQAIFLNIKDRHYHIFGFEFFAHDTPNLIFIFLGAGLFIAFVTSIFGRLWCGWTCPQTVFLEAIFRKIENFIEGGHHQRRKFDNSPWSYSKVFKKTLKWFLFLIVSLHMSHSFLGLFVGSWNLLAISTTSPFENFNLFLVMLFLTGLILFDLGYFREQFCIILCPYGRLQSILMDTKSLLVAYDEKRGGKPNEDLSQYEGGDCVNCFQCVQVCPTNIDIRRGTQLECIACTACIDACDEIMEKVDKPKGLIRYTSEDLLSGKKNRKLPYRSFLYLLLFLIVSVTAIFSIKETQNLRAYLFRQGRLPYSVTHNSKNEIFINNHFKLDIEQKRISRMPIKIYLSEKSTKTGSQLILENEQLELVMGKKESLHLFFKSRAESYIRGKKTITINIENLKSKEILEKDVKLVGPY